MYKLLIVLLALNACFKPDPLSGLDVVIETAEDKAVSEVSNHPTDFLIKDAANLAAWERSIAFFKYYLNPADSEKMLINDNEISNKISPRAGFIYSIQRYQINSDYQYRIICKPGTTYSDPSLAKRNARNLARFIKTGILEVSLLAK